MVCPFNIKIVHPSWQACFSRGLSRLNQNYVSELASANDWLPGADNIFNAFSIPFDQVNYILFGESPYPRLESANGYAFWDQAVGALWSSSGLDKKVNRATSLRNLLKMLLIAEGALAHNDVSQPAIAALDKTTYVSTNTELFTNFLNHGFLLLNATLVLRAGLKNKDAKSWMPFLREILICLLEQRPHTKLILFGRIANEIDKLLQNQATFNKLYAEHPYNHSFITNEEVLAFFRPLHLLKRTA